MQRHGQIDVQIGRRHRINARNDPHRRHGDLPPAQRPHRLAGHPPRGFEDVLQIQHRLAHAHEHDGLQPPPGTRRLAAQMQELLDHFAGGEVSFKASLRGGAEIAAHHAPDLRRHASRNPVFLVGWHDHGFDGPPITEFQQQLDRPVGRLLPGRHAGFHRAELRLQALLQSPWEFQPRPVHDSRMHIIIHQQPPGMRNPEPP